MRIARKRPYADGTVAVEMDPLSLLCRLATSVPLPRFHTVKYSGVLAPASTWRSRVALRRALAEAAPQAGKVEAPKRAVTYRPWAELLKSTFDGDVLSCPTCRGRMKLVAMRTLRERIPRSLAGIGELTDVPERSPSRGPPSWKSTVLRRKALGDAA